MSNKCVTGCTTYTGGDIFHHKDCPKYKDSLSNLIVNQNNKIEQLEKENETIRKVMNSRGDTVTKCGKINDILSRRKALDTSKTETKDG